MCASAQRSHLYVYVFNTHGRAHCSTILLFIEALWRNTAGVIKIFEVFTPKTERGLSIDVFRRRFDGRLEIK